MNGVGFQLATPAQGSGGKLPLSIEKALASGYAEAQGALIIADNTNKWAACGADPTSIAAVAVTPGGTDTSGFNILGHKEYPPGYLQAWPIRGVQFLAPYIGTLPTTPGGTYGVTRDSDGVWKVDFSKDLNGILTYLDIPNKSPADAAGSGQDTLVLIQFLSVVVQEV